ERSRMGLEINALKEIEELKIDAGGTAAGGETSSGGDSTAISLIELAEILDQHKIWAESGGESGAKADLTGVNLAKADLTGVNLQGAHLHRMNLAGADLGKFLRAAHYAAREPAPHDGALSWRTASAAGAVAAISFSAVEIVGKHGRPSSSFPRRANAGKGRPVVLDGTRAETLPVAG